MDLNCRVCLQVRDVMVHIFEEVDQFQTDLASLLQDCGGLTVQNNDAFPKYLCQQCTQELLVAAEFRGKCQRAAKLLLDMQNAPSKSTISTEDMAETIGTTESDQDEGVNSESLILYETAVEEDNFPLNDIEIEQETPAVDEELITLTSSEQYPTHINIVFENRKVLSDQEEINKDIKLVTPPKGPEVILTPDVAENNITIEDVVTESATETTLDDDVKSTDDTEISNETVNDIIEELLTKENEQHDTSLEQLGIENPTTLANSMEVYNYDCRACGASFVKAINLRRHMEIEHNTLMAFACENCHKKFQVEENYRTHIDICGKIDPKENSGVLSTICEGVKKPKQISGKNICNYCGKCLQSSFSLKMHERTHTGERPFGCDLCQSQFKTQAALTAHKKRHTGKADFICKVCQKRFFDLSNLTTHMRIHTGFRPHSCTVCDKSFTRVFLLQLHMRTHTGERPFQCEHCQKSFSQSCDLKYHLTTHSNGDKKYTCSICPKTYIRRKKLELHMEKHAAMEIAQDTTKISEVDSAPDNMDYFIDFDPELS